MRGTAECSELYAPVTSICQGRGTYWSVRPSQIAERCIVGCVNGFGPPPKEQGRSHTSCGQREGQTKLWWASVVLDISLFCSLEPRSFSAQAS